MRLLILLAALALVLPACGDQATENTEKPGTQNGKQATNPDPEPQPAPEPQPEPEPEPEVAGGGDPAMGDGEPETTTVVFDVQGMT